MTILIQPITQEEGHRRWQVGPSWLEARRVEDGWRVQRSWLRDALTLPSEPALIFRISAQEATVAQLNTPLVVLPGATVEAWFHWPGELAMIDGASGVELEASRDGLRKSVLGAIESGRILPTVLMSAASGPNDHGNPGHAALHVRFESEATEVSVVRRFPVFEAALEVARSGDHLVAGTVDVRLHDAGRAESQVVPLPPLPDFDLLDRDLPKRNVSASLTWLLDATRRSFGGSTP